MSSGGIAVEGAVSRKPVSSTFNFVGPDFFQVMEIPVVLGRGIEQRDMTATPRVAVINETVASRYFGGGSPLGRRFHWSWKKDWDVKVIGVAKDARYDRVRGKAPATIYAPYTQRPFGWPQEMSFEVRTAGNGAEAIAGIRRAVAEIDRMLPLMDVKTQEAQIDDSLAQARLFASLVSLFGAITLVLACEPSHGRDGHLTEDHAQDGEPIGAQRHPNPDFPRAAGHGVRHHSIRSHAAGLPLTWALTRIIESQLYGVKPHDPLSLLAASAAIAVAAILAAFLPARRGIRIDPVRALRYE